MVFQRGAKVVSCAKFDNAVGVEKAVVLLLKEKEAERVVTDYYESLDPNTLYMRFMAIVKDPKIFVRSMVSMGCRFLTVLVGGEIAGVGELCLVDSGDCMAALSVKPGFRRRGLGSFLLFSMLCACRDMGGKRLMGEVLIINDVAIRFFRRVGGVLESVEDGVVRGYIPVEDGRSLVSLVLAEKGIRAKCGDCE